MQILLILSLALFAPRSQATQGGDGDHVGNGGGFAEMFLLSADRLTPAILLSCIEHQAECGLPDGSSALENLLSELPQLQKVPFTFSPQCTPEIRYSNKSVEIPSCLLYSEEKSLPEAKLLLFALKARVLQGKHPEKIIEWLKNPIERTQMESSSRALSLTSGELKVHYFRFENWMMKLGQFVFLETPNNSHDLSAILLEQLTCTERDLSYQIAFESQQQLERNLGSFRGRMYWNCGRKKFQANIKILAGLEENSELSKGLRIQLTRKEEIW